MRETMLNDHHQRESIRSLRGRNKVIAPEILSSRKTCYKTIDEDRNARNCERRVDYANASNDTSDELA